MGGGGESASRRSCDRKEVSLKVKLVGLERAARIGEGETEMLEELREWVGRCRLRRRAQRGQASPNKMTCVPPTASQSRCSPLRELDCGLGGADDRCERACVGDATRQHRGKQDSRCASAARLAVAVRAHESSASDNEARAVVSVASDEAVADQSARAPTVRAALQLRVEGGRAQFRFIADEFREAVSKHLAALGDRVGGPKKVTKCGLSGRSAWPKCR